MGTGLDSSVAELQGIGPTVAKRLAYLDIRTVEDLLWHTPFRYDDFRQQRTISDLKIGETATIEAVVELIANRKAARKRMTITEALLRDGSGTIQAVWFNQPFLTKNLKIGERFLFAGKVRDAYGSIQLTSPSYEKAHDGTLHVGRFVPIYATTAGLTQKQLRFYIATALHHVSLVHETLPQTLLEQEQLLPLAEALRKMHFPADENDSAAAVLRLKFDELLLFQLRRLMQERGMKKRVAEKIPFDAAQTKAFVQNLPFQLTPSQKKSAWDILQDMEKPEPMNRLLEGDVGSGKTVVAAIAALSALNSGFQVLIMAPTEVLARQHFLSLGALLEKLGFPLYLWTHGFHEMHDGATVKALSEKMMIERCAQKIPFLLIGTHALLEEHVQPSNIGLVIVDEQQRFGVGQRERIHTKGAKGETLPHFLSLTATPIPRTLALSLAGGLQLSTLTHMPVGRKPIQTTVILPEQRLAMYHGIERELEMGRQAFVIAPLIEESDALGVTSATELFQELTGVFARFRVGLLHGKLSSKDKDAVLTKFVKHELDILVATAVIEVGIDVPNATVMVIEGAERFGLAQLHQLRGRVGRGEHQSSCFLLATQLTSLVRRRLDAVAHTQNGFQLAELDLELRGPGDLVGTLQSGFLDFQFASLGDAVLIEKTSRIAQTLLHDDPHLASSPELLEKLSSAQAEHRE